MMRRWLALFFFIVCQSTMADQPSALIDPSDSVLATVGELDFRPCLLKATNQEREVQCAWVETHENPEDANSKPIKLFVARLPARRVNKTIRDPLLMISGGPGQAASASFLFADKAYAPAAKFRDIYLVDQRGTGHSHKMHCPALIDPRQLGLTYSSNKLRELTQKCLQDLPGNPIYYTTDYTVKDLETVRKALKISHWNLFGTSYGTRVATHYMRQFPESIRAVILDSPIPPQHILGSEISFRSQQALDQIIGLCNTDPHCKQAMPHLNDRIQNLLSRLETNPAKFFYEHFTTGKIKEFTLTRDHIAILIRLSLYSPNSFVLLPTMLYEAAVRENYAPIARSIDRMSEQMSDMFAMGLHNSVMCSEEFPFYQKNSTVFQKNNDTYMGMDIINMMEDMCSIWPTQPTPKNMKDPLHSKIPTLIFSGQFDPITPPQYANEIVRDLPQSLHLELKGQAHSVSHVGCSPHIIAQFLQQGSVKNLATHCLNQLHTAPIFINFNGTAP